MRQLEICDKRKGELQTMIRYQSRKTWNAIGAVVITLAMLAATLVLPVSPVYAHAPEGAGEAPEVVLEPIQIYDQQGNLLEISIDDVAEKHGDLCVCVAGGYRVTQAAISVLYSEDELPTQGNLTLVYHHPGKGHKQGFELILTPECVTYEKIGNPQKMTMANWVYTFTRLDTGEVFETRINEGIIAEDFFELRYEVNGYEKGWHYDEPTEEEKTGFAAAYTQTFNNLMTLPAWELYSGVEEPEEPAPVAAIAFSGALIVLIGTGFVYSARGKRR
jgi:hypothetical protein